MVTSACDRRGEGSPVKDCCWWVISMFDNLSRSHSIKRYIPSLLSTEKQLKQFPWSKWLHCFTMSKQEVLTQARTILFRKEHNYDLRIMVWTLIRCTHRKLISLFSSNLIGLSCQFFVIKIAVQSLEASPAASLEACRKFISETLRKQA